MAGRRADTPRTVERSANVRVDDPGVERALMPMRAALIRLESRRTRDVIEVDLVVGTNKVQHGLGRPAVAYSITPTVADATFAHAIDRTNPTPDLSIWITVVGVAQPGAIVEVT